MTGSLTGPGTRAPAAFALALLLAGPAFGAESAPEGPGQGRAAVTWHWIQKLQTTGSVLYIGAHPDDERGDLLALLSRGHGVRVSLLSLTRGEGGANAIGPELFDGLGWIRAAELEAAAAWYGVDRVWFTPLADYGFSKSLAEARRSWDEDAALADVVEVVRRDRPMVIVSRFSGTPEDGHGQHQFAGRLARRARFAAADGALFPPREGRRAFLPEALFIPDDSDGSGSGFEMETGGTRAWLDHSFAELGAIGLSLQRSQTRGVVRELSERRSSVRLRRDESDGDDDEDDVDSRGRSDLLEMLSPQRASLGARFGPMAPGRLRERLERLDELFGAVAAEFDWTAPEDSLPRLGEALTLIRGLLAERSPSGFFDVRFELETKEKQLTGAALSAAGLSATAVATNVGGPVVPGQTFEVDVTGSILAPARFRDATVNAPGEVASISMEASAEGGPVSTGTSGGRSTGAWGEPDDEPARGFARRFEVALAGDAPALRPHLTRSGPGESRYRTEGDWTKAAPPPAIAVDIEIEIPAGASGEPVTLTRTVPVTRREPNLPYGILFRELEILPPVSVSFDPAFAAVRRDGDGAPLPTSASLEAVGRVAGAFRIELEAPDGWRVEPEAADVSFERPGERARVGFSMHPASASAGPTIREIRALVGSASEPMRPAFSHRRIARRDLPLRYDVVPAVLKTTVLDLAAPDGLRVGFVVGAGDLVPEAMRVLGAEVVLLDEAALLGRDSGGGGGLGDLDAVVLGTRAYAFRPELAPAGRRLLDYVENGGHLVVLYNTEEFVPDEHAPFPGTLPARAEEVTEEDSEVRILAPDHPLLNWPNRITSADFDGWVEQRGSKFWSAWDSKYTALFETADEGQAPQRGGALTAGFGNGRYTWFAFALHRQLPEGAPGAFRLLANLIAASRNPSRR